MGLSILERDEKEILQFCVLHRPSFAMEGSIDVGGDRRLCESVSVSIQGLAPGSNAILHDLGGVVLDLIFFALCGRADGGRGHLGETDVVERYVGRHSCSEA